MALLPLPDELLTIQAPLPSCNLEKSRLDKSVGTLSPETASTYQRSSSPSPP